MTSCYATRIKCVCIASPSTMSKLVHDMSRAVVSASSDGTIKIKAWSPHSTPLSDLVTVSSHVDYVRCLTYRQRSIRSSHTLLTHFVRAVIRAGSHLAPLLAPTSFEIYPVPRRLSVPVPVPVPVPVAVTVVLVLVLVIRAGVPQASMWRRPWACRRRRRLRCRRSIIIIIITDSDAGDISRGSKVV
jgi:hypothetical protein